MRTQLTDCLLALLVLLGLLALLSPLPVLGIGHVYTGVGGGGRELLDITSVTVDVEIDERVARTRTDQVFTNRANRQVEGIYEFTLPEGAIITDLVLWIGDKRVQGLILEKEEARQTYDAIVRRNVDPALVEQVTQTKFRLSIFPFPAGGSRRVEFEYMQILDARHGAMEYTFPLAPETEQPLQMELFVLRAQVRSQHAFTATTSGLPQLTEVERPDEYTASVFYGNEQLSPQADFTLAIRQTDQQIRPTMLSFAPRGDDPFGYYALWLPPLTQLTDADPLPRSLTFVIDISSSMQRGKLQAVKGALNAAVEDLQENDLFNIVVFTHKAEAWADEPLPATADNKTAASAFINRQDALGVSNFEAGLSQALQQVFPQGRQNHVVFLTDGWPTIGETEPEALKELAHQWSGGQARLFTVGVGDDLDRAFLTGLAEDNSGEAHFLSAEGDIEVALRALFLAFTFPVFVPQDLAFAGLDIHDVHPRGVEVLSAGEELFQVGRYLVGGPFTLTLSGQVQEDQLELEFPLELAQADTSRALLPRLWAHQKVQALEDQIARFGTQNELLDNILALGLDYRLVTRRTSLFAPDDGVEVNPRPRNVGGTPTAVGDDRPTNRWLGRDFFLQDGVWIDQAYQPGMPRELYEARPDQPAELAAFAELGQAMVVVAQKRAYEIRPGLQVSRPVLGQNAPNPFNASTTIAFQIPHGLAGTDIYLRIYNLAGQLVRVLQPETRQAGEHRITWDGRDSQYREAASGVYIYRLEAGEWAVHQRMLLLR
ncbi:MAG: VWA domain-containing protein [Candidatus Latescibacteria bacterium]|nr:VWA domain-containing protein [Candidatus Latescibacterota bacterium]